MFIFALSKILAIIFEKLEKIKAEKKLPKNMKIDYDSDLPCEGDILKAYYIILKYHIIPEKKLNKEIIGTFFLKWNIENKIEIIKVGKNNYNIKFNRVSNLDNKIEDRLFRIFSKISGNDKILEVMEIKKINRDDYYKINYWIENLWRNEEKILKEKGLIQNGESTETLAIDALKLKGFRNYLKNMSNISNREILEVNIWGEYLIFAKLLGVANKVEKQFKKLYPNLYYEKFENVIGATNDYNYISNSISRDLNRLNTKYNVITYYSSSDSGGSYSSGGSSAGGSSGGGFR